MAARGRSRLGRDPRLTVTFYGPDLAWIHDHGFGDVARGAAPALLRRFRDAGLATGTVVDLGCGSGIWAAAAARAGYDVIGIDTSGALLEIARREAPDATFHCAEIDGFPLPSCGAITAIGEVLSYVRGDPAAADPLRPTLTALHAALRPGGMLAFDALVAGGDRMNYRSVRKGDGWEVRIDVGESRSRGIVERRIVTHRRCDGKERTDEEIHRLRVRSAATIEAMLIEIGFRVTTASGYGAFALPPRRRAFFASR